jgi:HAD superfamily hydrolase (TIGR01509 family)
MDALIIFDFDGVVVDSELIANEVLAEMISELGVPMTTEAVMRVFVGKRLDDVVIEIGAITGRPVDASIGVDLTRRTLERFRRDLREMPGLRDYISALSAVKRCIASSSSRERIDACLDMLRLRDAFSHVFSASQVARGKPHPDLFLHAASQLAVEPANVIVLEDSEAGIRAAVAGGMLPIGFVGGSHIGVDHEARLRAAGARYIARSFAEALPMTQRLLQGWGSTHDVT